MSSAMPSNPNALAYPANCVLSDVSAPVSNCFAADANLSRDILAFDVPLAAVMNSSSIFLLESRELSNNGSFSVRTVCFGILVVGNP